MKNRLIIFSCALTLLVIGGIFAFRPAIANPGPGSPSINGVEPVIVPGNPNCIGLGYDFGFKPQPEPPPSGTYTFPDGVHTVTIVSDGTYFDWTSTLGVDAVIAKGGPNANVYVYDPPAESFGDSSLHAPINPSNGQPFGLSHIEFCYDYEVTVSKTAETTFTRTWAWEIEKSVTPDSWDLFTGDSGTSAYTVTVTKTGFTDSDWAVSGAITIENDTPLTANITGVVDSISGFGTVAVNCGVTFPYELPPGQSLECSYSSALPDGDQRTNTATVSTEGLVGGGEATADVTFGDPTTEVNAEVNVTDTFQGDLGAFPDSGSTTYDRTFTCDGDEGQHNNTATIVETGQSDDASVSVNCHQLEVTKDAQTSFTRTWNWDIQKTADQTDLTLSPGQQFTVNYSVTVDADFSDSGFAVSGNIAVHNPSPIIAELIGVSDIVSGAGAAAVDCGVTFPYDLAAGATLDCTYESDLPDASSRTNTATASLLNKSYDSNGISIPDGTTQFSGTAAVDFSNAVMTEVDECVNVTDSFAGNLGTVCAIQAPQTFHYSRTIGPFTAPEDCGQQTVNNTATFITNDTGSTGSDSWTVNVTVPCDFGCTLTPGYWKTHSSYGPAPYDDTWASVGEDSAFYSSGVSYYTALWTPPKGNAYWILAHAYIAAYLNGLNGADTFVVANELVHAVDLLTAYTPEDKLSKAVRQDFIDTASKLDQFNNGLIGPGHCSE